VALSGTADLLPPLVMRLSAGHHLGLADLTGRSIAMGGLTLAALLLSLAPGQQGLHLAASPEGPYFAINVQGGAPVQS
jgi:3-oxoacyl-[acyl-carrier-protein] synthase II